MYRKLFYIFNFAMLASFIAAIVVDHDTEWRKYQQDYFTKTAQSLEAKAAKASDPEESKRLRAQARQMKRTPLEIHQIIIKDLGRIDRCITCHVGMDEFVNPSLTTSFKEEPFKGHPDISTLVKNHPFQKFGCTACHAGQGLATSVEAAHGYTENWEKPLLKGDLIQSSCAKCHGNFESLHGAQAVALGKKLFETHGCLGCHSINNVGGAVSVDLGDIADKPLERIAPYNFSLIKTPDGKPLPRQDWKLPGWILAHMTNVPMDFIPNDPLGRYNEEPIAPSGMPDFTKEFSLKEAEAVTSYLMSKTHEEVIPIRYYVPPPPKKEPKFASAIEHGKYVFEKYGCAGCHGVGAKQGRRNFNALGKGQPDVAGLTGQALVDAMAMGVEPTLPDTVGTFSREELIAKIQNGVLSSAIVKYNPQGPTPPLYMPAWKEKIKGQESEDLVTYLLSIAKKEESW